MADDADKSLKIGIDSKTSGLPEAKQASEVVNETAKAAGAGAEATKDLGNKAEEAGEQVHFAGEQHREFNHLLNEANAVAPGLGHVLRGLFNPELMGIGLAIFAVKTFIDWLKEGTKSASEMADKLSQLNTDVWTAQVTAIGEVKKAIDESNKALGKSFDEERVKGYYALLTAENNARLEQEKKMLELLEKQQLAQYPDDKTAQERIKNYFDQLLQSKDFGNKKEQISILSGQSAQEDYERMRDQADLDKAKTAARTKTPQLAENQKRLQAAADTATKDQTAAEAAVAKADEDVEFRQREVRQQEGYFKQTPSAANADTLKTARGNLAESEERRRTAGLELETDKLRVKVNQDAAQAAADQAADLKTAIAKLTESVNAHAQAHREAEAKIREQTALLNIEIAGTAARNAQIAISEFGDQFGQLAGYIGNLNGFVARTAVMAENQR